MSEDIFNRAIVFAVEKHAGALRKGTGLPYIIHPMEAAAIVATMTEEREVLAAAVLHDVMEDAGVDRKELAERFGERVAGLVASESEDKRKDRAPGETWRVRKEEGIAHLRQSRGPAVKMIALGDKLSNLRSMVRDEAELGPAFWQRFNQKDKAQHAWYYRSVAQALEELSSTAAWKEYNQLLTALFGDGPEEAENGKS